MNKVQLPTICDNTITVIQAIEKASKEILVNTTKRVLCIIFLRECSGGKMVQTFLKAYWDTSYHHPIVSDKVPVTTMDLADGKQWMEMLERGESVLDGLVR